MADHLRKEWNLSIKPGSKEIIVAKGGEVDSIIGSGWRVCAITKVLGWPIQDNGGYREVWHLMVRKAWGAFWGNCRCRNWNKLGVFRQMALLSRSVEPFMRWYLRSVLATHYKMQRLDALQRRMVSIVIGAFRYPRESWKSFCSRRSRAATKYIQEHSHWWSRDWACGNIKWLQHLERDFERQKMNFEQAASSFRLVSLKTSFSFAPRILHFKPASWVQHRRTVQLSGARVATRTKTRRAGLGKVQGRWEETTLYSAALMGVS